MNRTIVLLIAVLALGGLTAFLLLNREDEATTLATADREFAIKDADRIGKIFLADRQGNRTTLERKGDDWVYNGKYPARENAIKNLLDAITRVEMAYKPANAAVTSMVSNLATEGIKVEIYDRGGDLLKTYYVGGAPPDERGTYMMIDGHEQPYVTHIPGWDGNLRFRYNLLGDEWRSRLLFPAEVEEVQSVSVAYPRQRSKSFRLQRQDGGWQVAPFYESTPLPAREVPRGRVEAYLTQFPELSINRFVNETPERAEVESMLPFAEITLTRTDGSEKSIKLYPRFIDATADPKTGYQAGSGGIDGYFGSSSEGDFMLVQHYVIDKVLWSYEAF